MNQENTKKIIAECPIIFADMKKRSTPVLPIHFGIECGDGWFDILRDLCTRVNQVLMTFSEEERSDVRVIQIKEKYGTLRFYMSHYITEIEDAIDEASKLSGKTCEQCGAPGALRGTVWIYAACDEHTRKEDRGIERKK